MRNIVSENIEVLRARAERYRRLAQDLFDPRTSEEAVSLARELDAEVARLLMQPQAAVASLPLTALAAAGGAAPLYASTINSNPPNTMRL